MGWWGGGIKLWRMGVLTTWNDDTVSKEQGRALLHFAKVGPVCYLCAIVPRVLILVISQIWDPSTYGTRHSRSGSEWS